MFAYRSPVGVDCKFGSEAANEGDSERQQEKTCIGGTSPNNQLIDEKGSRSGSSSAEDPGELLHRQTDEADSERQQLRIQEKTCIGGASRKDQPIDEKGSRSRSSSAGDPGELLHRQTEEGRFGTSTAEDPGEGLHRRRDTAGSPHRRKRIKEWIFIGRGSRKASTSTDGRMEVIHFVARVDKELENGRKLDELKERSEVGRTKERLEIERTRERSETGRTE